MNQLDRIGFLISKVIFILLLGLSMSATASTDGSLSIDNILRKQGYKSVSMTIKNGFLYIKSSINKHPATAILDTGSSGIGITKSATKQLKLTISNTSKEVGVDMHGKTSFEMSAILPHATIGPITLKHIKASIFQHVLPGSMPTLVVGRDFLQEYYAIIDLYNKRLYLGHKKLSQHEMNNIQSVLLSKQLISVPLMSLASGSMVIPLQINHSQPVNFLFDTGTGITLISRKYATLLNLKHGKHTKDITLETLVMNPLNMSFQSKIALRGISVQPVNLAMLRKYLYVQGIFGLSDMIKARAIIFVREGILFLRSDEVLP